MGYRIGSSRRRSRLGASWTTRSRSQSGDRHRVRPEFLELEERRLLATFTVTSAADDGSPGTLRSAIAEANGTFGKNTIQFDPTVFDSIKTITLTPSQLELSNTSGTQTIIGPAAGVIVSGGNVIRVLQVDAGVTASISGLTFTGGKDSTSGGGVYNLGNSTLTDCTISGNTAANGNGGGLLNVGTASLTGCTITNDSARDSGGGLYSNATLTMTDCQISLNNAGGGGGLDSTGVATLTSCTIIDNTGGGVANQGSITMVGCNVVTNSSEGVANSNMANLENCTITGNSSFNGGGVGDSGTINLSNCTLSDNSAANDAGGLFVRFGTANLTDCTFTGDSSPFGGGLYVLYSTATLINTTISGNSATYANGGGLGNFDSTVSLTDCTVSDNTAPGDGGGIISKGTLNMTACTVSGNSAPGAGGGLFNQSGAVDLIDTIVAGNTTLQTSLIASDIAGPSNVSGSFNLIGTGGSDGLQNGSGNNIVLPTLSALGLAPLGYYGGPTETMPLLPGSAAISKGTRADYPGTVTVITTDERGEPLDSPASIGAFQFHTPLVVDTTVDGLGSPSGPLSLRQAVNLANVMGVATTILFDPTVFARTQTVTLTQGPLDWSGTGGTLTINGPTAGVIVSGGGVSQVFVVNLGAVASITGLTIADGASGTGGGGFYNSGTLSLTDCTISGNSANNKGGGLYSLGIINLINCTISNNSAGDGGGLEISGAANLTDCTISGNAASVKGGGLYDAGTVTLENTIVAGNTGSSDSASDIYGTIAGSSSYNLIGIGGSGGLTNGVNNNVVLSSLAGLGLAQLGDYGGPTDTMAVLPGSAAIGNGTGISTVMTDQRGASRPTSGAVDIGAFQNQGFTLVASSGSAQSSLVNQPFSSPLAPVLSENFANVPLPGATIEFSAPASGSSATLSAESAVTNASGLASVMATANATAGTYVVTASAIGVTPTALFDLTNQITPTFSGLNGQTVTYGNTLTFTGTLEAGAQVPAGGEVDVTVDGFTSDATIASDGSFSTQIARSDVVVNAASTPYTVAYEYVSNGVFLSAIGSSQLLVNPVALTVTAVANTKAFDGTTSAAAVPTITSGSLAMGDIAGFVETYNTENVGTGLTLTPSGTVDDSNNGQNYTYTFVALSTGLISVAPLTITASPEGKTYGQSVSFGNGSTLFSSTGLENGETIGSVTLVVSNSAGAPASPVGSYTITPSAATGGTFTESNYAITYETGNLSVTAAPLTITATPEGKTYGQSVSFGNGNTLFSSTGLQNGETIGSVTLAVSNSGGGPTALPGIYTITPSAATGGTFTATNYAITYATANLTVAVAPLTITASSESKAYGQSMSFGNGSTLFSSTGLQNGETIGSVTLVVSNSGGGRTALPDSYTITPSAAAGGTFTATDYAITYVTGNLTVTVAPLTITASSASKTYGQSASFGNGSTLFSSSGLANGETIGSVTLLVSNGGGAPSAPVGSYAITPSAATGGTFTASDYAITYATGNLSVNEAPLTITASPESKTYGQTVSFGNGSTLFSSTGLQNGETIGSVTLVASNSAGAPATPVGSYTITPSAATGSTFTGSNYAITYDVGTLTVNEAPLSITATSESKSYGQSFGGSGSSLFTSTGLENGETIGSVTLFVSSLGGYPTAVVGSYVITPSDPTGGTFNPNNYSIVYGSGTLTILEAPLEITAGPETKVYGQTLSFGAGSNLFSSIGLQNGETIGSVTLAVDGNCGAATAPVGSFTITPTDASGGTFNPNNYSVMYETGTLTVTLASLTIVANDASIDSGQPLPSFTAQYEGLVLGQGPGVLTGQLNFNTPASSSSPRGAYPIVPSGQSSPNYSITYVSGVLDISLGNGTAVGSLVTVTTLEWQTEKITRKKSIEVLVISFSGAINSTDASDLAAYTLDSAKKAHHKTTYSKPVPLAKASYDAASNSVMLSLRGKVPKQTLQLTINSADILDASGGELEGNSTPGGNFVARLNSAGVISMAKPVEQTRSRDVATAVDASIAAIDFNGWASNARRTNQR
jgi:hypothetical protein